MSLDLAALETQISEAGIVARVLVLETAGSAPREAGASMTVWGDGQSGTIGGGALEFKAAANARRQLRTGKRAPRLERIPLGPGLGQCCGGSVTLLTEIFDRDAVAGLRERAEPRVSARPVSGGVDGGSDAQMQLRRTGAEAAMAGGWVAERLCDNARAVWLYGAGHVGRAIARTLAPLPGFGIMWLDVGLERFPESRNAGIDIFVAKDLPEAVAHAPDNAVHLVMTYSHAMDLEICSRILSRPFRSAGVIGSATKWARFRKRLIGAGHKPDCVDLISCPIGDPRLGKHPQAIAVGVAARLLTQEREQRDR